MKSKSVSSSILDRLKCTDELEKKIKCQVQSFPSIDFLPLNKSYRAESQYFTSVFFSLNIYFDQIDDNRM